MLEERGEVGAERGLLGTLVPAHEHDAAEARPLPEEHLEGGRGPGVDGEGGDGGEGEAEAVGEEDGVGDGGGEVVAPGGEEGEVEALDAAEAGGDPVEVADVAAEGEGGAGGPLQGEVLAADEGEGVAGARVGHEGEDVGQDGVGEVADFGGVAAARRHLAAAATAAVWRRAEGRERERGTARWAGGGLSGGCRSEMERRPTRDMRLRGSLRCTRERERVGEGAGGGGGMVRERGWGRVYAMYREDDEEG